ncbi:MAG: hypothetical protein AAFQ53_00265 [Bacteroidota bacterium]
MLRPLLAVAAGFAAWTVSFFAASAVVRAAFPDAHLATGAVYDIVPLIVYLIIASAACLLAGITTRRLSPTTRWGELATAVLLLAVGLGVQLSSWTLAPAWYHVAFLALLVPMTLVGARVATVDEPNGAP